MRVGTMRQTNRSAARSTRGHARTGAGATHTIRIGYGDPGRPFAIRHLVLEQLSNQAAAMGFLVVTDTVYLKALLPKTPHTLVEATGHRNLEGVWVRMESPAVEGFGHATGTLDSDPLTVSWCASGDAVVVRETPDNRLPVIVGLDKMDEPATCVDS